MTYTKNDDLHLDIKNKCKDYADAAMDNIDTLKAAYWDYSKEIQETSFSSHWEQMKAIRKLSQLGLALHAAGDAYSAINTARCN